MKVFFKVHYTFNKTDKRIKLKKVTCALVLPKKKKKQKKLNIFGANFYNFKAERNVMNRGAICLTTKAARNSNQTK